MEYRPFKKKVNLCLFASYPGNGRWNMNQKKINRRKFLINSFEAAAGIGVLANCDKRAIVGPDVRAPSAPVGLSQRMRSDGATYSVNLQWTKHNLTDNTGAKTETQVLYNIYRKTDLQTSFDDTTPLVAGVPLNSYSDTSPEVQDAFARMLASPNPNNAGISFEYHVRAVDADLNISVPSDPALVPIQPFVPVYTCKNTAAVTNPNIPLGTNSNEVGKMLDAVIMKMTNQTTVAAAWESLFPSLSLTTLIGIKINTLAYDKVSTKPAVVEAIVNGLTQMLSRSFPVYNIIVFDDRDSGHMHDAGFDARNEPGKYRITSTKCNTALDPAVPVTQQQDASVLWGDPVSIAGVNQKFSKIVESVDYIINVPVIKDHAQSGITFSLKNLYGLVDDPNGMHSGMCSPFIPALGSASILINGIPVPIKNKIRVIVGDALAGCFVGGPDVQFGANMTPCTLIVGTDPVALDSWALDTINAFRSANNLWTIEAMPDTKHSQDARHLYLASQTYNLGSMNYTEVEASA